MTARTRVFDRGTSGVKLTPAGAVLYRYAKSIVRQVDDARLVVPDEDKYPTGRVTIVSSYCISIMRGSKFPRRAAERAFK